MLPERVADLTMDELREIIRGEMRDMMYVPTGKKLITRPKKSWFDVPVIRMYPLQSAPDDTSRAHLYSDDDPDGR